MCTEKSKDSCISDALLRWFGTESEISLMFVYYVRGVYLNTSKQETVVRTINDKGKLVYRWSDYVSDKLKRIKGDKNW